MHIALSQRKMAHEFYALFPVSADVPDHPRTPREDHHAREGTENSTNRV